jgi:integrase
VHFSPGVAEVFAMPRPNAPWFRKSTNSWYSTIDGKKVPLGVRGKENRKPALIAFGELLAGRAPSLAALSHPALPSHGAPSPAGSLKVRELVDRFLAVAAVRLKPATVARYRYDAGVFAKSFGSTPAEQLTGDDFTRWAATLPVSDTSRAISLRSVRAVLGWAAKAKLIRENPARGVPLPKCRARAADVVINETDHAKMLAAATPGFRLVLRVLHATGCRPGEVAKITAENLDAANGVAVIRDHKTDRTGKPRLVFLPPDLAAELAKLATWYGSGPLLRSRKGKPWNGRTITQAMRRLKRRAGVKCIAYGYRHSFATDALANGVPEAHVAELLGHSGTAMLHKHYSHLGTKAAALRAALGRVRG